MSQHDSEDTVNDIFLRPFNASDAKYFVNWATFDALSFIKTEEKGLDFIQNFASSHPYFRAICLKSGVPIGTISVTPSTNDYTTYKALVGYAVAPLYRGQGIATKAVTMVVRDIFGKFPYLERVGALVEVGNMASQRVLEKVGFMKEGVLRKYMNLNGKPTDLVMYSLLSSNEIPSSMDTS